MTCPLIQPLFPADKKWASAAISCAVPTRLSRCLAPAASFFSSELSSRAASGVSVSEGAMQLTRIVGAHSAASERTVNRVFGEWFMKMRLQLAVIFLLDFFQKKRFWFSRKRWRFGLGSPQKYCLLSAQLPFVSGHPFQKIAWIFLPKSLIVRQLSSWHRHCFPLQNIHPCFKII